MLRTVPLLVYATLTLTVLSFVAAAQEYKIFETDKKEHAPTATGKPFEASCEEPFSTAVSGGFQV